MDIVRSLIDLGGMDECLTAGWLDTGRILYNEGKNIVILPWMAMIVDRCVALCRVSWTGFCIQSSIHSVGTAQYFPQKPTR